MREVNKTITINKPIPVTFTNESIILKTEDFKQKQIFVTTEYSNDQEAISGGNVLIEKEFFDLLMMESPDFSPNILAGKYEDEDLWHVIDLVRAKLQQ